MLLKFNNYINILTEHLFPGNFSRSFQEFEITPMLDENSIEAMFKGVFGNDIKIQKDYNSIKISKSDIDILNDKNATKDICKTFKFINLKNTDKNNIIFGYDSLKYTKLTLEKTAVFLKKIIPNSIVKIGKYSINIRYSALDKNNYFSNNLLSMHIDGAVIPLEVEKIKETNGRYSIYLSELSKKLIRLYEDKNMSLFYGDQMIGFNGINPITTGDNKVKIDKFVNSVKIDFVSKGVSENSSLLIILFIIAYLIFLITILYLLFKKKKNYLSFLLGFTILFLIFGASYTLIFSLYFSFAMARLSIKHKIFFSIYFLFFTTLNFYLYGNNSFIIPLMIIFESFFKWIIKN